MGQIDFEVDVVREARHPGGVVRAEGAAAARPAAHAGRPRGRTFTFVLFNGGPGGGVFKAEILADGKTMSGEVKATMGRRRSCSTGPARPPCRPRVKNAAVSSALEGTWTGSLDVGGNQIGLILTIANRPDGTASVLIAQAARPEVQVDAALKETGTAVSFEVPATQGAWQAR